MDTEHTVLHYTKAQKILGEDLRKIHYVNNLGKHLRDHISRVTEHINYVL